MSSASVLSEGNPSPGPNGPSYDLERVEFPSCGVTLRGVLLRPRVPEPTAAIAIAPGMSGVKEGSIMKFADRFASAGMAVLAYDNINFGESDGEPRQEADPMLQRGAIGTQLHTCLSATTSRRLGSVFSAPAIPAVTFSRWPRMIGA
jgi:dienelactone hydrolase